MFVLNVPLGVINHVEKIGRARQKGDNVIYGLDIHCKVLGDSEIYTQTHTPFLTLGYEDTQICICS